MTDASDGFQNESSEPETSSDKNGEERQSSLETDGIHGDPDEISLGLRTNPDTDSGNSGTDSQDDEFAEWHWLEQIDACAHVGRRKIAQCDAKLIRHDWMRYDFLTEIQEPENEEASALGFDLFDRYGCLRREFYEHEEKQDTGVWGKELEQGDILLIGNITVDFLYRRNGAATEIVKAILDKTRRKSEHFFVFARAQFESKVYDPGAEGTHREKTNGEGFFRSPRWCQTASRASVCMRLRA
ncbi:hypothetical protein B0J13DRAFT_55719 [Dactylonectria estremocensis]|uniref:Uncharacterized protein n=1 Tax=Dactylonectria estremocensis TaxID=1079267 RepID=A0A9P9EKP0_9HYPO|nr:hypothetical protein B0J13DRAFT_55719 [Dactylonectria estremocensis]